MAANVQITVERIKTMLDEESRQAVKRYFDRTGPFAADSFNMLGSNEPNSIEVDDLFAVHLLGMDFDPRAVRELLGDSSIRDKVSVDLGAISRTVCLWEPEADKYLPIAEALWSALQKLDGVGPIVAGKMLARKRPRLIPIYDKWVRRYLDPPDHQFWATLQGALRQDNLPDKIEEALRPDSLKGEEIEAQITTLRLLDVAIWMRRPAAD